jgi:hypothetical protein
VGGLFGEYMGNIGQAGVGQGNYKPPIPPIFVLVFLLLCALCAMGAWL